MQLRLAALYARRDAAVYPLEHGRLSLNVQQRTAGLAIFQRTMRKELA
jgi:hypothetical protein